MVPFQGNRGYKKPSGGFSGGRSNEQQLQTQGHMISDQGAMTQGGSSYKSSGVPFLVSFLCHPFLPSPRQEVQKALGGACFDRAVVSSLSRCPRLSFKFSITRPSITVTLVGIGRSTGGSTR